MAGRQARGGVGAAAWLLALAGLGGPAGCAGPAEPPPAGTELLSQERRLTFSGRRAGEGYFSADGTRMVFQSERRPDNPFYQIYWMDLDSGETRPVSPGIGKTTCAFFRGDSGEVIYSSTHHDPASRQLAEAELARRAAGQERRYAWDYDPEMEIYATELDSGRTRRLTQARGYDAEASSSPDGEWIVFASNRAAYASQPGPEDRERLEIDPAFFADLYRMRADGSDLERLTEEPGYDGGPFYFADGSRIVWRRFDEAGLRADLYSMRPDGSDVRRLTDFGSMSWAPYPHPSGRYVFFSSNLYGFENFELFIVDSEGLHEPVRITDTPGFDGLPVPTPDGQRLTWTSTRHGEGGQIYMADWNHAGALAALERAPLRESAGEDLP